MSYSNDFRECVLHNISLGMSWRQAAKTFSVSTGSITRWLKNKRETGLVSDSTRALRSPKKIDPDLLRDAFEKSPDATLAEIAQQFNCWPQSIHKRCLKLGITRKKNKALR
jgi:transposase